MIIPFGEYSGQKIDELPSKYLRWLSGWREKYTEKNQEKLWEEIIEKELSRKGDWSQSKPSKFYRELDVVKDSKEESLKVLHTYACSLPPCMTMDKTWLCVRVMYPKVVEKARKILNSKESCRYCGSKECLKRLNQDE